MIRGDVCLLCGILPFRPSIQLYRSVRAHTHIHTDTRTLSHIQRCTIVIFPFNRRVALLSRFPTMLTISLVTFSSTCNKLSRHLHLMRSLRLAIIVAMSVVVDDDEDDDDDIVFVVCFLVAPSDNDDIDDVGLLPSVLRLNFVHIYHALRQIRRELLDEPTPIFIAHLRLEAM